MPYYENVFIARQDISAAQVEALTESFTAIITERGGKVTKKESWGLRNLAYRIKKNKKGHYVLLNIDAPWEAVAEMERNMRLNEDIIRYLTIRVDELDDEPSVMMQSRHGRDGRGFRRGRDDRPRGGSGDRGAPRAAAAEPAKAEAAEPAAEKSSETVGDEGKGGES